MVVDTESMRAGHIEPQPRMMVWEKPAGLDFEPGSNRSGARKAVGIAITIEFSW